MRWARERKIIADVGDIYPPAEFAKFSDDAPVVAVASGRRGEIARYGERNMLFLSRNPRTVFTVSKPPSLPCLAQR